MKRNFLGFGKRETYHARIVRPSSKPHAVESYMGAKIYRVEDGFTTSIDRDSVHDTLSDAKAFIKSWKKNPAIFDRCVQDVKRSLKKYGRTGNAYAICRASQKNRARVKFNLVPLDIWTASMMPGTFEAIEKQREKIARGFRKKKRNVRRKRNPEIYTGYSPETVAIRKLARRGKTTFAIAASAYSSTGGDSRKALAVIKELRKQGRINPRNPADAAREAYKGFHGRDSEEEVRIVTPIHYHKHTAGMGDVRMMQVLTDDGKARVKIRFSKPYPILSMNEKRTQMFIDGGDQSLNLKDFGITDPHENEVLGKLERIHYFTTKDHLGDEGGTAIFDHKFGKKEVGSGFLMKRKFKKTRQPTVTYDVPNQLIGIAGGGYTIPDEGIDG